MWWRHEGYQEMIVQGWQPGASSLHGMQDKLSSLKSLKRGIGNSLARLESP
uniref:Uncharacterized protein n=1 Tax=Arundo donax TaxID=35708 RepID=A0A0A9HI19_ARUDO